MNVVLSSIVGSIIGFIVASIVRPPYPFFKFTIIHIGIGNAIKLDFLLLFDTLTWLPLYEEKELLKCSMICDLPNSIEIEENLKFCICVSSCVVLPCLEPYRVNLFYREYWECASCPHWCFMSRPKQSLWRLT